MEEVISSFYIGYCILYPEWLDGWPVLNHDNPCAPVGFADDGALCFRGICPDTLVEIAQPKIDMAVEWGAQN